MYDYAIVKNAEALCELKIGSKLFVRRRGDASLSSEFQSHVESSAQMLVAASATKKREEA